MSNENMFGFEELDLGSQSPITVPMEQVDVIIDPEVMVDAYAEAFVKEVYRINPLRAKQVELTKEEMIAYARFLLKQRINYIHDNCPDWRRLKRLFIPVFLQYAMRLIGEVIIRSEGIKLNPVAEFKTITLDEAIAISNKVGAFEDDVQIVQDAFPRDFTGNESVMGTALIAGYVRSIRKVDHVSDTYITAFLGMKLREEQAFQVLYRQRYDDLNFIYSALTAERRVFK